MNFWVAWLFMIMTCIGGYLVGNFDRRWNKARLAKYEKVFDAFDKCLHEQVDFIRYKNDAVVHPSIFELVEEARLI